MKKPGFTYYTRVNVHNRTSRPEIVRRGLCFRIAPYYPAEMTQPEVWATSQTLSTAAADTARGSRASAGVASVWATAVMAAVVLWEAAALFIKAGRVPLWYDELLTYHVSALHPFSAVWQALNEGVDGMPAGYYAVVQLARILPLDPHIAVRLPSILGYILTIVAVFCFVKRRVPPLTALTVILLLTLSPFRVYATEARSYSLLVGSLAASALFWQRIGEQRFATLLFGLSLTFAVSLHHLAVVAISAFGIAEIVFGVVSRRIRWSTWIAIILAFCPFFLGLPALLHFRSIFGRNFWSRPHLSKLGSYYETYFAIDQWLGLALLLFCGFVVIRAVLQIQRKPSDHSTSNALTTPELVLAGGLLFYPALLLVLTKVIGSGYVPRYGWPAILGLIFLLAYLLGKADQLIAGLTAVLLLVFLLSSIDQMVALSKTSLTERWTKLALASGPGANIPVVIADAVTYLEANEYAPQELRSRLVELADTDLAVHFTGMDTADRANALLMRYVRLRLEEPESFEASHPQFILCFNIPTQDWLIPYLMKKNYHLTLLAYANGIGDYSVYLVSR
jgi:hypothetical protein